MKHLKEWKLRLYVGKELQTDDGSWRYGYAYKGEFWACVKPVHATTNYTNTGIFEIAEYIATINKPRDFAVTTNTFTIWGDRVLKATKVEDIDGKTRGDVRIYLKSDDTVSVEQLLGKIL